MGSKSVKELIVRVRWRLGSHRRKPTEEQIAPLAPAHRLAVVKAAKGGEAERARLIVEEARAMGREEDVEAEVEWAKIAFEVLEHLRKRIPEPRYYGLAAVAWAHAGDASRRAGRGLEAEKCLESAQELLSEGTQSPEVEARVAEMQADLLRYQGRHVEVVELMREAAKQMTGKELAERRAELYGRLGAALWLTGERRAALDSQWEAVESLPGGRSPAQRIDLLFDFALIAASSCTTPLGSMLLNRLEAGVAQEMQRSGVGLFQWVQERRTDFRAADEVAANHLLESLLWLAAAGHEPLAVLVAYELQAILNEGGTAEPTEEVENLLGLTHVAKFLERNLPALGVGSGDLEVV